VILRHHSRSANRGSTFIIVLWIAFGLVSLALYFAHAMTFELRAGDARVAGMAAEQAIEGAARYVGYILGNLQTNGMIPDPATYASKAVPLGTVGTDGTADARFWIIGRETNSSSSVSGFNRISFGLVDEASKLNLNFSSSNMLYCLPRMTEQIVEAIIDWRGTNGSGSTLTWYGMQKPPYQCKNAVFETEEELRLVMDMDMDLLTGEDRNRNGILDPDEQDDNSDGVATPGLLEYVTVFSREPNTYSNTVARVDVSNLTAANSQTLRDLLQNNISSSRANQILQALNLVQTPGPPRPPGPGGGGGGGSQGGNGPGPLASALAFYRRSGMTVEEFAAIEDKITVATGDYIQGRININTASSAVLGCLPGLSDNTDLAATLESYRETNPDKLSSIGWIVEALGSNNASVLTALEARDCLTTRSYQFSADIAAVGQHGRGFRRVRFVFETLSGLPRIIYRQDLTHLGWALGRDVWEQKSPVTGNTKS
jgi:type II secretory pathway component PulK